MGPDSAQPVRLDVALVRRGLARSRGHAATLVKDGAVELDGTVVSKASVPVHDEARLTVRVDAEDLGYASRAAYKLGGALDALGAAGPTVAGTDCLDVGASTGGFTDVLLRRGARSVVALDVGHDQLVPELRADPRVHVVERFNARELTADALVTAPTLVVADVSFISLALLLPALATSVPAHADLLLMVKPQFEVGRERLGSGGVVRSDSLRTEAVTGVVSAAAALGLGACAVVPSPLPGPGGNREYFVWFTRAVPVIPPEDGTIGRAVAHPLDGVPDVLWLARPQPVTPGGRP